jgi:hypothetical protein
MGAMLVCWVLFPAVLGALSLGCGLALEKAAATQLPTALLIPAGFAAVIALAGLPLLTSALAKAATPVVVAVAIAGLTAGRRLTGRRPGAAIGLAVVVFLVYGAPVILSGDATFLGFRKLDDTSTWLGITDWVMSHGRAVSGLAPSTYEFMLHNYVGTGYPLGSLLPVGIGHVLLGQDVAWLFQPTIAFMGAMLGLSLYGLLEPLVDSRVRRSLVALIAAQPAILIGYAWWGGIKEIAATALIALIAALAAPLMRGWQGLRGLLPVWVGVAALVGVMSAGGIVLVIPALLAAVAVGLYRYRHAILGALARFPGETALALAVGVLLLLPALATLPTFAGLSSAQFSTTTDLGVLSGPISALHGFGIWPSGDLRSASVNATATDLLVAIVILAAVGGLALAWERRGWGVLLYALTSLVSGGLIFLTAGPWVGAKALAIASPAAPLCALAAAAVAYERGWRLEAAALAILVAGGVLWSNVLQYHAVNVAPRAQLLELQQIGNMIAGQGPTLLTSYDPYGARHFLRKDDPESVSDLRRRPIYLRSGSIAANGTHQDLDAISLSAVLAYRSLVVRTSPVASRPPSAYRLLWRGRFYDVWQRPASFTAILSHGSLGSGDDATAIPACSQILQLARIPGTVRLAYVLRDEPIRIPLGTATLPPGWTPNFAISDIAYLGRAGRLDTTVTVTHPADYTAWVGNSFRDRLELLVDGHEVGTRRNQLNFADGYTPFWSIALAAGRHILTLLYSGPDWRPGTGGDPLPTGPVVLGDQTADRPVGLIAPPAARALCGKRLDWVEALG